MVGIGGDLVQGLQRYQDHGHLDKAKGISSGGGRLIC